MQPTSMVFFKLLVKFLLPTVTKLDRHWLSRYFFSTTITKTYRVSENGN